MGILEELTGRLELGLSKYTHGVWVDDDTRHWGTPRNSWLYMAREEFLDAMIYIAADYIQVSGMKHLPRVQKHTLLTPDGLVYAHNEIACYLETHIECLVARHGDKLEYHVSMDRT